jgi:hypothetical protein
MDLRFTEGNGPLFIDVACENADALFAICTSQVAGSFDETPQLLPTYKKRPRDNASDNGRRKKQMRVVEEAEVRIVFDQVSVWVTNPL